MVRTRLSSCLRRIHSRQVRQRKSHRVGSASQSPRAWNQLQSHSGRTPAQSFTLQPPPNSYACMLGSSHYSSFKMIAMRTQAMMRGDFDEWPMCGFFAPYPPAQYGRGRQLRLAGLSANTLAVVRFVLGSSIWICPKPSTAFIGHRCCGKHCLARAYPDSFIWFAQNSLLLTKSKQEQRYTLDRLLAALGEVGLISHVERTVAMTTDARSPQHFVLKKGSYMTRTLPRDAPHGWLGCMSSAGGSRQKHEDVTHDFALCNLRAPAASAAGALPSKRWSEPQMGP